MTGSIAEKLQRVEELYEVEVDDGMGLPTGLLRHAVLNSIPLTELVKFFIEEGSYFKADSANLCKRLSQEKDTQKIYDQVFEALKESTYLKRQRLRQLLEVMIPGLDEFRQLEYITHLLSSNYIYEQISAAELAEKVWNKDIQSQLINAYHRSGHHKLLAVVIIHADEEQALQLIREYWTDWVPKALIVKFLSRLKGRSVEELDFVRTIDPANYIALLRHAKGSISNEKLMECYYAIEVKTRPFALWNIGHLGKWELIEKETGNFLNDPTGTFRGFSDHLFEK
jgi:hypothetical protein